MSPTFRFVPAMYRAAVVDRIKTQTRRVIVPQPGSDINPVMLDERSGVDFCFQWHSKESRREPTYGPPGTVLPVVTTWAVWGGFDTICPVDLNKELIVGGSAPKARYHGIWWDDGSPKGQYAWARNPWVFATVFEVLPAESQRSLH